MVTTLRTQYRMANPICRVVSDYLYGGELQSSSSVMKREYSNAMMPMFPEVSSGNIGIFTYDKNQELRMEVRGRFFLKKNTFLYISVSEAFDTQDLSYFFVCFRAPTRTTTLRRCH